MSQTNLKKKKKRVKSVIYVNNLCERNKETKKPIQYRPAKLILRIDKSTQYLKYSNILLINFKNDEF